MDGLQLNVFGPFGQMTDPPSVQADGYPLDLDGSLTYTRPALGFTTWPAAQSYPNGNGIGMINGMLPQFDAFVYNQMIAKLPASPSINPFLQPVLNPIQDVGQTQFPTLFKIGTYNPESLDYQGMTQ